MLKKLRKKVLKTAKELIRYRLVVLAGGTVCARDPKTGYICITPSGMDYDKMTWEDIAIIDENLNIIESRRKISVASQMFIEILKARKDLNAVIHTHSIYATAFACIPKEIPCITTTQGNLVGGNVPVVEGLELGPFGQDFYKRIVKTLGNGFAVNLMSHGPIVTGRDLDECLEAAVTVEVTAQTATIGEALGNPYYLAAKEAKHAYDYCKDAVGQKLKK